AIGQPRGDGVAEHAQPFTGHVLAGGDRSAHVVAGVDEGLSHLLGDQAGQLVLSIFEDAHRPFHDLGALGRGRPPPRLLGAAGRLDGGVDVAGVARLELAEHLRRVRRVAALESLPRHGRHPLAIDVVQEGVHGSLLDPTAICRLSVLNSSRTVNDFYDRRYYSHPHPCPTVAHRRLGRGFRCAQWLSWPTSRWPPSPVSCPTRLIRSPRRPARESS